jgi:hypothetical protein
MHTYILKHWEAIQGCQPPADPPLNKAERYVLELLAMTPADPPMISAFGHVLSLQGDCDTAAFFMRTAFACAEQNELTYPALQSDRVTLASLEARL